MPKIDLRKINIESEEEMDDFLEEQERFTCFKKKNPKEQDDNNGE